VVARAESTSRWWLSLQIEPEVGDMLGHHWEPGEATIIAREEEHEFTYWPDDASVRNSVVDVRPPRARQSSVPRSGEATNTAAP
jgi:hypothetical protein